MMESRAWGANRCNRPRWATQVIGFATRRPEPDRHHRVLVAQSPGGSIALCGCGGEVGDAELGPARPDRPGNTREFIGQGDGGFVVTAQPFEVERPALESGGGDRLLGVTEHRTGAVDQQHAEVRVAALADGSEASSETARVLARREAKVTREVARRGEAPCVTDERDKAGGREEGRCRGSSAGVRRPAWRPRSR